MSRSKLGVTRAGVWKEPLASLGFVTMCDLEHKDAVVAMMRALYAEDEAAAPVDESQFSTNVVSLVSQPARGRIVLFKEDGSLSGYALLIPFWSNEFGGTLLFVDEMYVIPQARSRGIGRRFFEFLTETRPFDALALALEVSPGNAAARRLYESVGFRERRNSVLTWRLPKADTAERDSTLDT